MARRHRKTSLHAEPVPINEALRPAHEEPSNIHMIVYGGTSALFALCGIYLIVRGLPAVGVLVLVLDGIWSLVLWLAAAQLMRSNFAATHAATLTHAEQEFCEREPLTARAQLLRRRARLGALLVPDEDADDAAADGAQTRIEAARASEALACEEWLDSLGDGPFEQVETTASDGVRLCAHLLEPASEVEAPRWAIIAHGYSGSWRDGIAAARGYATAGYGVCLIEQRGYGASGGAWISMGVNEGEDIAAWARYLVARVGESCHLVAHGLSAGAAAVCYAAAAPALPAQVAAIICDSCYAELWPLLVGFVRDRLRVPPHPLLDMARILLKREPGGFDLGSVCPAAALKASSCPVLIVHGEDDHVVPASSGLALARAARKSPHRAPDDIAFELVRGAGHLEARFADAPTYRTAIETFLAAHVAP